VWATLALARQPLSGPSARPSGAPLAVCAVPVPPANRMVGEEPRSLLEVPLRRGMVPERGPCAPPLVVGVVVIVIRIELDGPVEVANRLLVPAEVGERHPPVAAGVGVAGLEPDEPAVVAQRALRLFHVEKGRAPVVQRVHIVWIEGQRFPEVLDRLAVPLQLDVGAAPQVVHGRVRSQNNPILLATKDDSVVNEDRTFSISPYTNGPDASYPAQTLTVTEDDLLATNIRVIGRGSGETRPQWNVIELDIYRDYHEGFAAILDASGSASIVAMGAKVVGAQFAAMGSARQSRQYSIHCGAGDGWVTVREDVVNNSDWPSDQQSFKESFPKTRAATGDREKVCPPPPVPAPRPRVVSFSAIQSHGDLVLAGQTLHGDKIGGPMHGYLAVSGSASIIGVASKMYQFTYYEHADGHALKASVFGPVDSGANEVVRFNCGSGSGWAQILYLWKDSDRGDTVPYAPHRRFKICN